MVSFSEMILRKAFRIDEGKVRMLNKIDYIMMPARAMAKMLQKIGEDFGKEFLFELGYKAGTDAANEFFEHFKLAGRAVPLKLNFLITLLQVLGFGRLDVKILNVKTNQALGYITKHPVIEAAKNLYGRKSMICAHYMGVYSVHADRELSIKGCKLTETRCVTKGDPYCEWSYNVFSKK
ncbi:hypothetical protein HYV49_05055 [Candidatus Pacearchaeota archaeon]|nr:hypothetical protein [Candidatus Pacearchaeota archaeon]